MIENEEAVMKAAVEEYSKLVEYHKYELNKYECLLKQYKNSVRYI